MESEYLFFIERDRYGYGVPFDPYRYESIQNACHRLRARIAQGITLVRVEVKRIQD